MKAFVKIASALLALLLAGCGQEPTPTPEATQTSAPPLNITYCDIQSADLCLKGFDQDDEGQMLIFFLADDRSFAEIYVQAEVGFEDFDFVCAQSPTTLENVFCLGDVQPDVGEAITLNIFSQSSQKQIARGVFFVEYSALPEPDVDFTAIGTPASITPTTPIPTQTSTPKPSYPNPTSQPSYPNPTSKPSYPNPTSEPE